MSSQKEIILYVIINDIHILLVCVILPTEIDCNFIIFHFPPILRHTAHNWRTNLIIIRHLKFKNIFIFEKRKINLYLYINKAITKDALSQRGTMRTAFRTFVRKSHIPISIYQNASCIDMQAGWFNARRIRNCLS